MTTDVKHTIFFKMMNHLQKAITQSKIKILLALGKLGEKQWNKKTTKEKEFTNILTHISFSYMRGNIFLEGNALVKAMDSVTKVKLFHNLCAQ